MDKRQFDKIFIENIAENYKNKHLHESTYLTNESIYKHSDNDDDFKYGKFKEEASQEYRDAYSSFLAEILSKIRNSLPKMLRMIQDTDSIYFCTDHMTDYVVDNVSSQSLKTNEDSQDEISMEAFVDIINPESMVEFKKKVNRISHNKLDVVWENAEPKNIKEFAACIVLTSSGMTADDITFLLDTAVEITNI